MNRLNKRGGDKMAPREMPYLSGLDMDVMFPPVVWANLPTRKLVRHFF